MIICSDFDSTIYFRDDAAQTAENFAALKSARAAGHTIVLDTNRSLGSLESTLPDWRDYFDYLILDGGTRIMDREANLIHYKIFPSEPLAQMVALAEQNPAQPKIAYYSLDGDNFTLDPSPEITKIRFWFQDLDAATEFYPKIKTINRDTFFWSHEITFEWKPTDLLKGYYNCVDVSPSNKAVALSELLKDINGRATEVITVGDNTNDYEMINQYDGYAIAGSKIATLHPSLKTTPSIANLIKAFTPNPF